MEEAQKILKASAMRIKRFNQDRKKNNHRFYQSIYHNHKEHDFKTPMNVETVDYTDQIPEVISQRSMKSPTKGHSCTHGNSKDTMMKTFKAIMLMNEGYVNKISPYNF